MESTFATASDAQISPALPPSWVQPMNPSTHRERPVSGWRPEKPRLSFGEARSGGRAARSGGRAPRPSGRALSGCE
eukprot:781056-Pleurochrysis_carterae.AAC.1